MMKILHIHTDLKFIRGTARFEGELFDNTVVIIGHNLNKYKGPYSDKALLFDYTKANIKKVIKLCAEADLVVLHDLTLLKRKIALSLSTDVKVGWRFFGHELYSLNRDLSFSKLTKQAVQNSHSGYSVHKKITTLLRQAASFLKWGFYMRADLHKAIKRIDYIFAWSEQEYESLKLYTDYLPKLIKLPLLLDTYETETARKEKNIIIGNNRASINNHLDIIKIIKERDEYTYMFPFSYGSENEYINKVKEAVSGQSNIILLENFMPQDQYMKLFTNASAFVLNSYKQAALGNVFMALTNNVKIYLNTKNSVYHWLKSVGVAVFTIEEFEQDIKSGNLMLNESEVSNNKQALSAAKIQYSQKDFQQKVYNSVTKSVINNSEQ